MRVGMGVGGGVNFRRHCATIHRLTSYVLKLDGGMPDVEVVLQALIDLTQNLVAG